MPVPKLESGGNRPHYLPSTVRSLCTDPSKRRITRSALETCGILGIAPEIVWETLAEVDGVNCRFIKTVNSEKRPGEMLDVYDAAVQDQQIYIKIKVVNLGDEGILVVLSFKRNEYYD